MKNAIDQSVFENLKATAGADFIGELIDTFLSDSPEQIQSIRSALISRDVQSFKRAAHSLKSTAASFGASQLSSLALELEGMAKANNLEVGTRIEELQSAFDQAAKELEGLRA